MMDCLASVGQLCRNGSLGLARAMRLCRLYLPSFGSTAILISHTKILILGTDSLKKGLVIFYAPANQEAYRRHPSVMVMDGACNYLLH